jgi:hypothetical protein
MRKTAFVLWLLSSCATSAQSPPIYPAGSCLNGIPISRSVSATTGAVSLGLSNSSKTVTYLCHWCISSIGGTASSGPVTVTGPSETLTYQLGPNTATVPVNFCVNYWPCLPVANATGIGVPTVNSPITIAATTNGTATAVNVEASGCWATP